MTREQFLSNPQVADAVVRNFITIGEAPRYIPSDVQSAHPRVPWADMRAMRNFLIHGYDQVELRVVWDTVARDLPGLPPLLQEVMETRYGR